MPRYIALLSRSDGGEWGVSFPDFPGCISSGDSFDGALRMGSEALHFHAVGMLEDGDPIPAPRDEAQLRADPEFAEDFDGAEVVLIELLPFKPKVARRVAGAR